MKFCIRVSWIAIIIFLLIESSPLSSYAFTMIESRQFQQLRLYSQVGEYVEQITWSPTGDKVAIVIGQQESPIDYVVVYDSTTLQEIDRVEGLNISDLAWSSSGEQLATIERGGLAVIKVWDISTSLFSLVMEYQDYDVGASQLTWRPNSDELTFNSVLAARSINSQTGEPIRTFIWEEDYTTDDLGWSPDGTKLLVDTARALMWDANDNLVLNLWNGFFFSPFDWSPDSTQIVVEQGEDIQILDAETGTLIRTLEGGFGVRTEISWKGTVIAAGRDSVEDFGIYVWDSNTGEIIDRIETTVPPTSVTLSPDGTQLAFGGDSSTLEVIAVPGSQPVCDLEPIDISSLVASITTANSTPEPDTICLAEGDTYTFTSAYASSTALPAITSDITIEGNGATLTRSGTNEFRFFRVGGTGTLTLNDTTLTNGHDNGSGGGAITVEGGTVSITNSHFVGNTSTEQGGVIDNDAGAVLTITNTSFANNSATGSGGVINNDGQVTITESTFSNNTAGEDGGVIDNDAGTTLLITDTSFSGNSAGLSAGVINNDGNLTISGSSFTGNTAAQHGGVIDNDGTIIIEAGSLLEGNEAAYYGGSIRNGSSGTITISDSTLRGNIAGDSGGAIRNSGNLTILNTLIEDNTTEAQGGGIALSSSPSSLILTGSQLLTNTADDDGGGLYIGSTSSGATVNDTIFSGNHAGDKGGAIYDSKSLTMDNGSQLLSNTASQGGGFYASSTATATVHNTCISGNSAKSVYRGASPALNFTGNWWGAANGPGSVGPGSGDTISSNITYSGFLTTNSVCQ